MNYNLGGMVDRSVLNMKSSQTTIVAKKTQSFRILTSKCTLNRMVDPDYHQRACALTRVQIINLKL